VRLGKNKCGAKVLASWWGCTSFVFAAALAFCLSFSFLFVSFVVGCVGLLG
jgi:hypothetical protein